MKQEQIKKIKAKVCRKLNCNGCIDCSGGDENLQESKKEDHHV